MKKILITGAGSYIGTSLEKWLQAPGFTQRYRVDTIDMQGEGWKNEDFTGYDAVFHVAGIAHADIGRITREQKKLYDEVNCVLAVETAKKAKQSKVKQFLYMSSIIVYGENGSLRKRKVITRHTKPSPSNFYGGSKWKAEQALVPLGDESFQVAILRPPMIYGRGSRGNYPALSKLAGTFPLFPDMKNKRSMLYIENLCEFVRLLVEAGTGGVYFPQNREQVRTSEIVREIAAVHRKRILVSKWFNAGVYLLGCCPGRIGTMIQKAFGSLEYEQGMSEMAEWDSDYRIYGFKDSIRRTEGGRR